MHNIIAGLDVGSSSVRLIVGQKNFSKNDEELQIIGAVESPSNGFSKGIVGSIDEVTSAISSCLDKAERLTGVPINSVWLGINTPHMICEKSKGVVAISRNNGDVMENDIKRAEEASKTFSMPPNYQILHTIPVKYAVDNQEDIKNPIGMTGVRLEVETLIVRGISADINNLTKAVYRTGLDINDLVLSPISAGDAILTTKQRELGAVLVNIGSSTTSIAVFEEGSLLHTAILRVGSEDITKDLAICLRCPIDLAEKIKLEYGNLAEANFRKDEIDISDLMPEYEDQIRTINPISRKYIAEVIGARVDEIFEKVDKELKKIGRSGMLPAGVFLIGGGSRLEGVIDRAKKVMRLPVCIGKSVAVNSVIDKVNDPVFLNALGLVVHGSKNLYTNKKSHSANLMPIMKNGFSGIKKWFSSLGVK